MKANFKTLGLALAAIFFLSFNAIAQWGNSGANTYNTNAGNVGISTGAAFNATAKLQVVGPDNNGSTGCLKLTSGSQNMVLDGNEIDAVGNTLHLNYNSAGNVSLANGGGKVGIGMDAPNAPLQFNNDLLNRKLVLYETAANNHQFYGFGINSNALRYQVSQVNASHIFYVGNGVNASTELMRIEGDGQVGIGNANPDAGYKLQVAGNIKCSNITTSSDRRYKDNIQTLPNALDKVMAMRGTEYTMRTGEFKDMGFSEGKQLGFIAQELKDVLPELVVEETSGYMAVNYQGVIPVLVEAMKEQQVQIEEKDAAIQNLEARLAKLEQMMAQLSPATGERSDLTPAAIGTATTPVEQPSLFPNPSKSGRFTVQFPASLLDKSHEVTVFDEAGRLAARRSVEAGAASVDFDLPGAMPGVYFVQVATEGKASVSKLTIVK